MLERFSKLGHCRQLINSVTGLTKFEKTAVISAVILLLVCLGGLWQLGNYYNDKGHLTEQTGEQPVEAAEYFLATEETPEPAAEVAIQQQLQLPHDEVASEPPGEWVYDEVYRDWRFRR